ncbi:hypothetical protein [Poriferisphaera sp. WC338]|uniref:hypothetical protein n=1 Tax=Poriferisphaera sp. WC338 TaxID=3425129 RepID=UPI003D8133DD
MIQAVCLPVVAALTFAAAHTHAAPTVITSASNVNLAVGINDININGTTYTATFHNASTFNDIWNHNTDDDFNDVGEFTPTFLGNSAGAISAANQIIAALDTTYSIFGNSNSDSFMIPFQVFTLNNNFNEFRAFGDMTTAQGSDAVSSHIGSVSFSYPAATQAKSFVTFSAKSIPEPTSLVLFSLTTLPFLTRRKTANI